MEQKLRNITAYELLTLNLDATEEDIETNYKKTIQQRYLEEKSDIKKDEEAEEVFAAYEALKDGNYKEYFQTLTEQEKHNIQENFLLKQKYELEFSKLRNSIGKMVTVTLADGDTIKGFLEEVEDYDYIRIAGSLIDFVDEQTITKIVKNKEALYYYDAKRTIRENWGSLESHRYYQLKRIQQENARKLKKQN